MEEMVVNTRSAKERPDLDNLSRNGPGRFTKTIRACLSAHPESDEILLLPCSYFYPLPWSPGVKTLTVEEKLRAKRPESLAIHFWDGSWTLD